MTFDELVQAAKDRKAITGAYKSRLPKPAAFILSMPGSVLAQRLPQMEVYRKPPKKKRSFNYRASPRTGRNE